MIKAKLIIKYSILYLLICVFVLSFYIKKYFPTTDFNQLLFHLNTNLEGASNDFFKGGALYVIINSLIIFSILIIVLLCINKYSITVLFKDRILIDINDLIFNKSWIILCLIFISSIIYVGKNQHIFEYIKNKANYSSLYEEEYVDPRYVDIKFEDKQNLILIYVESLETTDFSNQSIGYRDKSLIPNLEKIYLENEHINTDNGLFYQPSGVGWTVAGMTYTMLGIPIADGIGNEYSKYFKGFFEGAYGLGDVLKDNGYNLSFVMGSDANFADRSLLLKHHGDYNIIDLNKIVNLIENTGKYASDWGVNDELVYDIAKDELKKLASENKPFALSLITSDTHPSEGYFNDNICKYSKEYSHLENSYICADVTINKFISWIYKQPFFDNTTIVIVGDHLAMYEPNLHNDKPDEFSRSVYNTFINSKQKYTCEINHKWSTMDLYPTILASMGAKINGEKLGLGVNMFSCNDTLIDKYGEDIDNLIVQKSVYYNECLINGYCPKK